MMQSRFATLLIFIFSISAGHASEQDCNSLLQPRWESSLNDLAVLRIDLDLQKVQGVRSALENTFEGQYTQKFKEILEASKPALSRAELENLLKQKIDEKQHELNRKNETLSKQAAQQGTAIKGLEIVSADSVSDVSLPFELMNGFALKTSEDEITFAGLDSNLGKMSYSTLNLKTQQFDSQTFGFEGELQSIHYVNSAKMYVETKIDFSEVDLNSKRKIELGKFEYEVEDRSYLKMENGQYVFSGGYSRRLGVVNDTKLFDLTPSKPKGLPWLPETRAHHQLISTPDGKILVVGGMSEGEVTQNIEIIDPVANTVSDFGKLTEGRTYFTATVLSSGQIVVIGDGKTIEMIDPISKKVYPIGQLPVSRKHHAATLLADDRIIVSGGVDASGVILDSILLIDPNGQAVKQIGKLKTSRKGHHQVLLSHREILVMGGGSYGGPTLLTEKIILKASK